MRLSTFRSRSGAFDFGSLLALALFKFIFDSVGKFGEVLKLILRTKLKWLIFTFEKFIEVFFKCIEWARDLVGENSTKKKHDDGDRGADHPDGDQERRNELCQYAFIVTDEVDDGHS